MSSVNRVFLIGRLGKRPDIKTIGENKTPVCNFSLATSKKRGGKEETTWHYIKAFKDTAENCAKYLEKGSLVCIEGEIQVREWEKDGEKRTAYEIVAHNVQFLSGKQKQEEAAPAVKAEEGYTTDDIPF